MNNEITYINNIFDSKPEHLYQLSFEYLVEIFSESNDFAFKRKLTEIGFFKRLYSLQKQSERDIQNRNWDWISHRPEILAFRLKGYHRDFILDYQVKSNRLLTEDDFQPIIGLPQGFIEGLEITRYQLLKSLYPAFSFTQFQEGKGKKEASATNLAPFMALDIDLPFDSEEELLSKLGKHIDIYCLLTSPSGGLRPIIRIDPSIEMMHQLSQWQHSGLNEKAIEKDLPKYWKLYLRVVFHKIQSLLKNETLHVNGSPAPFELDEKCKNLNRFWHISRNKGSQLRLNQNARPIRITRKDCVNYSKKAFPPYNDIFAGF